MTASRSGFGGLLRRLRAVFAAALVVVATGAAPAAAGVGQWTSIGPDGAAVIALAIDPSDAAVLYAGTATAGAFRSGDGGGSWVSASQGLVDSAVTALAVDPTAPATLYATTAHGVYRSSDRGGRWTATLPQSEFASSVACDPDVAGTVFAGSPNTVWVTRDGGRHWSATDTLVANSVEVAVDPVHALVFALGYDRSSGAFRLHVSGDHGQTWRNLSAALPALAALQGQLAIDPTPPGALYLSYTSDSSFVSSSSAAAAAAANPAATFQSTDLGRSWHAVGPGGFPLAVGPQHAVYAGGVRSLDSGLTWTPLGATPEPVLALAAGSTPGTVYAGGETVGVLRSLDSGQSWEISSAGLRGTWADAFAMDPTNPARIFAYVANDGALAASRDGGLHWRGAPNIGLCIPPGVCGLDSTALQFLIMAVDPLAPSTLYLASPDGLLRSTDGGHLLYRVEPQGSTCVSVEGSFALDPFISGTLYGTGAFSTQCFTAAPDFCGSFKSTDGGDTWTCLALDAGFIAVAPSSPGRLYALSFDAAGNQELYRSGDRGATWTLVNPRLPGANGTYFGTLQVDPTDSARIFAADISGGIWSSPDAGRSWRQILAAGYFPHLLAIDPLQPQNLYVASSEIGVLYSGDGGRSWQALARGLALDAFPYNQLTADPLRSGTVYLATDSQGILAYTLP